MKKILSLLLCAAASLALHAQGIQKPATWSVSAHRVSATEAELRLTASVEKPWIIYAASVADGGPMPLAVALDESELYATAGAVVELSQPKEKHDDMFDMQVKYFAEQVELSQRVALRGAAAAEGVTIAGTVEYQCCNESQCVLLNDNFSVQVAPELAAGSGRPSSNGAAADAGKSAASDSMLSFFLLALLAGFAGVLTPCVFPMLPMTISFFMRGNSRSKGARKAAVFGLSIILIYTAIGAIVAATKTAGVANLISAHWLSNLIFFALFLLFAASFLGAVELTLPSNLANSIDRRADSGGYFSTFFVALALTVISFSCTGPFVGALLVSAASGAVLKPVIGMFGFGLAFALPFSILALFPAALKKLPKSGSWLNAVKVFFAFILLLFSVKFLATADQALGLHLISRDVFLCIWGTLLALQGLYFLGKLRFAHDDEVGHVSVPRFALAVASLCFALYFFTGLLGNPLRSFSGFLPVQSEGAAQVNALGGGKPALPDGEATTAALCGATPKYSQLNLHGPASLPAFFDLEEAMACAKAQGKRLLIDFKGHTCANCKKMEGEVFADRRVQALLREKFVIAALYTDDKTPLPEGEWYTSAFDGKQKKTLGQKNMDYLVTRYKTNAIPYFAILNSSGAPQGAPIGYTSGTDKFIEFLSEGN